MAPSKGSNNFYASTRSEIDIRAELIRTLDGSNIEVSKKSQGLLRKMRLDSDGKLIQCGCVDPVTKEPDKDFFCPICFGDRWIWSEKWIDFYMVRVTNDNTTTLHLQQKQTGLLAIAQAVFYLKYDAPILSHDKIVEVNLDLEGNLPDTKIQRTKVWRINFIDNLRLDTGRVEFLKVFCSQEDVRYLNKPDK